jgi:hypothetical protein
MDSSVPATSNPKPDPHICDVLIAERAPRLTRSWAWPVVRPALYKLLNYKASAVDGRWRQTGLSGAGARSTICPTCWT